MKTSSIIKYAIGGLLVCTSVSGIWGWLTTDKLVDEMKQKMTELERQEKRSAVLKSISNQMEEITYQQMKLSDEQRLEAIEQRELAEQERRNAVLAQQKALASEHKAIDAYEQAQYQRIQADLQRQQAEYSKSVADTLSFLALGRSLGAQATTQFYAGNRELAAMLSDLAYEYTKRYHGDMYYPAIYQAIALSSQSSNNWPKHQGPITDLDFMPNTDDLLVTVSSYGEIMMHQKNGRNLRTIELLKDSKYDFRDVYVNPKNGHIYVLSRNSYMAVKAGKKITMIPLETIRHPFKIQQLEKSTDLLIIGEKQLALFDTKTNTVKETRNLDFNVTFTNRFDYKPIIFDDQGRMHIVESINKIITKKERTDMSFNSTDSDIAQIKEWQKAGHKVVVVLITGRPLPITSLINTADAFVVAWLPGSEGAGVADVLFGKVKPTGKLPHTWPKDAKQIPINVGDGKKGLYPYGFGLTY